MPNRHGHPLDESTEEIGVSIGSGPGNGNSRVLDSYYDQVTTVTDDLVITGNSGVPFGVGAGYSSIIGGAAYYASDYAKLAGDMGGARFLGALGGGLGSALDVMELGMHINNGNIQGAISEACSIGGGMLLGYGLAGAAASTGVGAPAAAFFYGVGSAGGSWLGESVCESVYDMFVGEENNTADFFTMQPSELPPLDEKTGSFFLQDDLQRMDDFMSDYHYQPVDNSKTTAGGGDDDGDSSNDDDSPNDSSNDLGGTADISAGSDHYDHPIVLDLDGDGIELIDRDKSTAFFDFDGDGYRNRTGWASGDDGLLAIDIDGDGIIDKGEELSFADWGNKDRQTIALAA